MDRIPHRAIIKTDAQSTAKGRPVLNCNFKVGKCNSLNETSCPNVLSNYYVAVVVDNKRVKIYFYVY